MYVLVVVALFLSGADLRASALDAVFCSEDSHSGIPSRLSSAFSASSVSVPMASAAPVSSGERRQTAAGSFEQNWAQARVGSSLWREDLWGAGFNKTNVGIVDSGFDRRAIEQASGERFFNRAQVTGSPHFHGTGVANTLLGFNRNADIGFAWSFDDMYRPAELRKRLAGLQGDPSASLPRVVNISYAMGNDPRIAQSLHEFARAGTLVVASSGNFGDEEIHQNNQDFSGVLVGSISPFGLESDYSQNYSKSGRRVDILAPADYYLAVNYDGESSKDSMGTSFAAPIVSGILSEAVGILGEEVSPDFLKALMKKTALDTINGIGMINRDKLLAVAYRIHQRGIPLQDLSLLEDPSLFDFESDAAQLTRKAQQARRAGNLDQAIELQKLAFHLNQQNDFYRKNLIQLYSESGLGGAAVFYESLTPNGAEQRAFLENYAFADRGALGLQSSAARLLARLNQSSKEPEAFVVARSLEGANEEDITDILESYHQMDSAKWISEMNQILAQTESDSAYRRNLAHSLIASLAENSPKTFREQADQRRALSAQAFTEKALQRQAAELLIWSAQNTRWSAEQERALRWAREQGASSDLRALAERIQRSRLESRVLGENTLDEAQARGLRWVVFGEREELRPLVRLYFLSPSEVERQSILQVIVEIEDKVGLKPEEEGEEVSALIREVLLDWSQRLELPRNLLEALQESLERLNRQP